MKWLRGVLLLSSCVVGAGCGKDTAAGDGGLTDAPAADVGALDAAMDAGSEPGVTLEIVVDGEPVVGAVATLDAPGGARLDGMTDASGRVTFFDIDWSRGSELSITAYAEPRAYAAVGFTEADLAALPEPGVVRVELTTASSPPPPVDVVAVSGTLLDRISPLTSFVLAASTSGYLMVIGDTFSGELRRGEPFGLVAAELGGSTETASGYLQPVLAWATAEGPAATSDVTIDLDFGAGVTPTAVAGSVRLPANLARGTRPGSSLATVERAAVADGSSAVNVLTSYAYRSDGTHIDYEAEQVLLPGESGAEFFTMWTVASDSTLTQRTRSVAWTPGLPGSGEQRFDFLDVPVVRSSGPRLHDPIDLARVDAGASTEMMITASGGSFAWLSVVGSARPVRFPHLPTGVNEATTIDSSTLRASIELCADVEAQLGPCDRRARLTGIELMP